MRVSELRSSTTLAITRCGKHCRAFCALTTPSLLSRATQRRFSELRRGHRLTTERSAAEDYFRFADHPPRTSSFTFRNPVFRGHAVKAVNTVPGPPPRTARCRSVAKRLRIDDQRREIRMPGNSRAKFTRREFVGGAIGASVGAEVLRPISQVYGAQAASGSTRPQVRLERPALTKTPSAAGARGCAR